MREKLARYWPKIKHVLGGFLIRELEKRRHRR